MDTDIDIVVVNYKRDDLVKRFLQTFNDNQPLKTRYTMTVIHNEHPGDETVLESSLDGSFNEYFSQENLSYSGGCNYGASLGTARYIGLFNNDIEFVNNTWLDQIIEIMDDNPKIGVSGPFQYATSRGGRKVTNAGIIGPGSTPQHRGWLEDDRGQYRFNEQVLMVMGSAMIIRREYWDAIMEDPVFNEFYPDPVGAMPRTPLYFEDTALCYMAPYFGYEVHYLGEPGIEIIHQWHQTINNAHNDHFHTSQKMFRELMDAYGIEHD